MFSCFPFGVGKHPLMYAQCIAHNIAGLRLFLPKLHTGIRSLGYLEAIGNKNLKRDTLPSTFVQKRKGW